MLGQRYAFSVATGIVGKSTGIGVLWLPVYLLIDTINMQWVPYNCRGQGYVEAVLQRTQPARENDFTTNIIRVIDNRV
jgi:hypothetical protein